MPKRNAIYFVSNILNCRTDSVILDLFCKLAETDTTQTETVDRRMTFGAPPADP